MTDAEIVTALATKVMGVTPKRTTHQRIAGYTDEYRFPGGGYLFVNSEDSPHLSKMEGWNPLTSDSDAFEVVDKLEEGGWLLSIDRWQKDWVVVFRRIRYLSQVEVDPDRRRAVALAALRVVEGTRHADTLIEEANR